MTGGGGFGGRSAPTLWWGTGNRTPHPLLARPDIRDGRRGLRHACSKSCLRRSRALTCLYDGDGVLLSLSVSAVARARQRRQRVGAGPRPRLSCPQEEPRCGLHPLPKAVGGACSAFVARASLAGVKIRLAIHPHSSPQFMKCPLRVASTRRGDMGRLRVRHACEVLAAGLGVGGSSRS